GRPTRRPSSAGSAETLSWNSIARVLANASPFETSRIVSVREKPPRRACRAESVVRAQADKGLPLDQEDDGTRVKKLARRTACGPPGAPGGGGQIANDSVIVRFCLANRPCGRTPT